VFIGGGGELGTAREVLRHKSVESVTMVDIDKVVVRGGGEWSITMRTLLLVALTVAPLQVDVCREHLPSWGDGAADDPRLHLHYDDAKAYLDRTTDTFDVIVMDIADPIEAGPGYDAVAHTPTVTH
jgi:spermidine synthase